MNQLCVGDPAPDFALTDHTARLFKLSDLAHQQNVLLVFNLGLL